MEIQKINDTSFLILETLGEKKLNPFLANVDHIRYIRDYPFDTGEENGYAVFVGEKMLVTKQMISCDYGKDIRDVEVGESFTLGDVKFQCMLGGGLTDDKKSKYFINLNNAYHIRKYINSNGNGKQLAIITIDGRVIPVDQI